MYILVSNKHTIYKPNINFMRKVTTLLFLFVFASWHLLLAQTKVVSGTVTSAEDGAPLIGASVIVKGTTLGVSTDIDGRYEIKVPENAVLVFSSLGFKDKEVTVGTQTVINVTLDADNVQMEEVVVTAIGIKRATKALGYAVQEVKADDLEKSRNTNVINSLSGKVAGVRINNSSGAAGASSFVEIRGSASITGNNQPLWVIDGVPIYTGGGGGGNAVDGVATSNRAIDINPDDIASMSVLKGGAATALYGLRAANGAIIITTKKGGDSKGKLNINASASVTVDEISQVPELQKKYGQGSHRWGGIFGESAVQNPKGQWYNSLSWGPKVSDLRYVSDPNYKPWDGGSGLTNQEYIDMGWSKNGYLFWANDPNFSGTAPSLSSTPVKTYDPYDFFQTGITQNYSLNMSKGNENGSFYFSYSNTTQKGIVPNNEFSKNTFTFNGNTKLHEKVTVGAAATYTASGGDRIQQGSNVSGVMLGLLRSPATFDNSYGYKFTDGSQRSYRGGGGYDNPYWTANQNRFTDRVNRLIGNVNVNYEATDWLNISYRLGTDWYSEDIKDLIERGSNANPSGRLNRSNAFRRDINSDLLISVKRNITEDFRAEFTLGHNMFQSESNSTSAYAAGLLMQDWRNMANTADNKGYEANYKKRTAAYFADLGLSYQSMLYMNFTGRYEWSTTMPENDNSFFYPSASLGFVFTELDILKENPILTFGKLRASYASIANDAVAYATKTYYNVAGGGDGWTDGVDFPFKNKGAFSYGNALGNADLKPETMNNFEIGADFRLWNGRLRLDVAYFKNVNKDLLLYVPTAGSTGITSRYLNAGEMETTGWEILFSADVVKISDFKWNFTLNWSNPETMVTKLADDVPNVGLGGFTEPQVRAVVGKPYRSIFGLDWKRDANGNVLIGADGYPTTADEMTELGTIQPEWTMGLTNTFTYKGITLSALIDIKHGGKMWNGTKGALYYFGTHKDTENRDQDYVFDGVLADGSKNTKVVKLDEAWRTSGEGSGFTGASSPYIEDAGWVRLREITLSYKFNPKFLEKTFINNLDVYFTGNNLWLSTDYTGIDPETSLTGASNAQGFDYFNMPGTKSYTFGLKIGF
jgi:TonB-linked SusC/RagA family outer membrane protein